MKNTLLIEKLQKVYNANINVCEKNFDMRYFYNECGTTGCLIGNAIINDPYFVKYGLYFHEDSDNFKTVQYLDNTSIEATCNFFDISELLADILFVLNVDKETALQILQTTINVLQNSNKPKLSDLIKELILDLEDDTIDYLYDFIQNHWNFVKDDELECIDEISDFLNQIENEHDVSFMFETIGDYLKTIQNLPQHIIIQFIERANAEKLENSYVEINYGLPTVFIKMSDDSEYFFQEHEASELLDKIPDNIDDDDYLLAIAQNW